jgi:hypothetical protein
VEKLTAFERSENIVQIQPLQTPSDRVPPFDPGTGAGAGPDTSSSERSLEGGRDLNIQNPIMVEKCTIKIAHLLHSDWAIPRATGSTADHHMLTSVRSNGHINNLISGDVIPTRQRSAEHMREHCDIPVPVPN